MWSDAEAGTALCQLHGPCLTLPSFVEGLPLLR